MLSQKATDFISWSCVVLPLFFVFIAVIFIATVNDLHKTARHLMCRVC